MNKILLIIFGAILVFVLFLLLSLNYQEKFSQEDGRPFQGPIPEGYNETCFRETGRTIPLGKECIKDRAVNSG